ncbi:unnamed protein product [Dicrocoelium dendriticum]|nr:unnamed protein product [Dicrocoelium dendriticum]CAH8435528.1 unnamed protein product [Dicrocoelium dendriticum]
MACATFEDAERIAAHIRGVVNLKPQIGIICGSGLGKLADVVTEKVVLAYSSIPGFPQVTVVGHTGNLVFGNICGKPVVVMQGRFHQYEGYSAREIALPLRVLKLLEVSTLLISNAAGGLSAKLKVGDFVMLKDHISLAGLSLNNVLVGPNEDKFGPRFPATSDAYCPKLRELMKQTASECGLSHRLHEGVYFQIGGPTYATDAECRLMITAGADVVGMSTVPEVHIARHCGITVFAISLVTDLCNPDIHSSTVTTHEQVLQAANASANDLVRLITEMIRRL